MDRRTLLTGFAAAGSTAIASAAAVPDLEQDAGVDECLALDSGPEASRFPRHVLVFDHHGRRLRFYDDLIKNKRVMINFMSTELESDFHTASNLARLQPILGESLGRDVFMYSISVDPNNDTPDVLADYAEQHKAGPGWLFLTGQPDDMQVIRDALFFRPQGHVGHHDDQDCSMGLIRYGNDAAGIWGSVPTRTQPEWLAARLSWVKTPTINHSHFSPVRKGPPGRLAGGNRDGKGQEGLSS